MNPRMIPELHDRHMDRLLGRQEDEDARLEAEREHGAEIAARELLEATKRAAAASSRDPKESRPRLFLAHFCGGIQTAFPELAIAIAKGAGMGHLYPEE